MDQITANQKREKLDNLENFQALWKICKMRNFANYKFS